MNASVGKHYGYELEMLNEFYEKDEQQLLNDIESKLWDSTVEKSFTLKGKKGFEELVEDEMRKSLS